MRFFTAATMRRLFAPRHELSCSWLVWRRLCAGLRQRGLNCTRESGAFLLGTREDGRARVVDFVLYDDLDPNCLASGIVRFSGQYFSELWAMCKARNLAVVADVHVHPYGCGQSDSDRDHPMISRAGHIALILPRFARGWQRPRHVGIYRYLGSKQWAIVPPAKRSRFFHVGF